MAAAGKWKWNGLGRIVFRNTRKNVATFPDRNVYLIPLKYDEQNEKLSNTLYKEFEYDIADSHVPPA